MSKQAQVDALYSLMLGKITFLLKYLKKYLYRQKRCQSFGEKIMPQKKYIQAEEGFRIRLSLYEIRHYFIKVIVARVSEKN